MLFAVSVLCRILYCLVCCLLLLCKFSRLITSVGEERTFFLLSFTIPWVKYFEKYSNTLQLLSLINDYNYITGPVEM